MKIGGREREGRRVECENKEMVVEKKMKMNKRSGNVLFPREAQSLINIVMLF